MNAMVEIDDVKMAIALDAMRSVELQANETIELSELNESGNAGEYVITDAISGLVLWAAPVPPKPYERERAWKAAQDKLDDLRRRRVILAIAAAVLS